MLCYIVLVIIVTFCNSSPPLSEAIQITNFITSNIYLVYIYIFSEQCFGQYHATVAVNIFELFYFKIFFLYHISKNLLQSIFKNSKWMNLDFLFNLIRIRRAQLQQPYRIIELFPLIKLDRRIFTGAWFCARKSVPYFVWYYSLWTCYNVTL